MKFIQMIFSLILRKGTIKKIHENNENKQIYEVENEFN